MEEKTKCKKCGLLIDKSNKTCPYCGYINEIGEEEKSQNIEEKEEKENKEKEEKKKFSFSSLKFPSRIVTISNSKSIYLFLMGFLGLQLISVFLSFILSSNIYLAYFSSSSSAILNYGVYFTTIGILIILLGSDLENILKPFKNYRTYLYGIGYGLLLIVASTVLSNILYIIFNISSSNANQEGVESIVLNSPILALLVFGIIGPICEELTYRVGLFNLFGNKNKYVLGYVLTCLIFGLLHFDFTSFTNMGALKIELVNLPSYILSGALLNYFYHKEGIGTSIMAHVTNNVFSILVTIIVSLV